MADNFWLLAVAGGPIILAIVIGYALLARRRRTSQEVKSRDDATRRLYEEDRDRH
ncbi:hypothetical protein [Pseudaminobacter sp. NGMCC 1.201702]|uniref:hypothetical protein n=1 Tax=Pseudaminobacter sp. NGMCC 1.201702 TaxID=3391825 RepID=UPI0039EE6C0C